MDLIQKIGEIAKRPLIQAPERGRDALSGLMPYKQAGDKKAQPKYALEGGRLVGLNLANTGLTDAGWAQIVALDGFEPGHIQALNLSDNALTAVPDLSRMPALKWINLSENKSLKTIDLSQSPTRLEKLEASGCALGAVRLPGDLQALKWLDLSQNELTDLEFQAACPALEWMHLGSNPLSALVLPGGFSQLKGVFAKKNELNSPPPEIVKQGAEAIARYFRQIEAQEGTVEILEAKMIIVGEGKTGKTTLFEKLKDEKHDPVLNPTAETHGINIEEGLEMRHHALGDRVFYANLWDFGGQELQYMTHQFFLTPRALYVLLMDARSESPNLPYWFKIISLLGRQASDSQEKVQLLLVFNKRSGSSGKSPLYQDVLKYYEDYLDVSYIEADLAINENNFFPVRSKLADMLVNLPIVKAKLPKQWKPIRDALREEAKKQPYINTEQLSEICSTHQITDERDQWQLSDYLHQLGSLLHFQNDEHLMDLVILSPEWAVEGVYCFLKEGRIEKQGGRFIKEDIFEILGAKKYSRRDAQKILKLMTKDNFDICYEASPGKYVAAQLLPDAAPNYTWHNNDALQFRYQYPIMPKGLMSRLIVRMSNFIERDAKTHEQVVWKKGAVLQMPFNNEICRIRLLEDNAESEEGLRQIIIEVLGEPEYRKYALQRVREKVEELHTRWFRSIKADEMVPCCCDECQIADKPKLYKLEDLLELKRKSAIKKKPAIKQCYSGEFVSIEQLLEGIYDKQEIEQLEREGGRGTIPPGTGNTTIIHNYSGQINISEKISKINYKPKLGIPMADFESLKQHLENLAVAQLETLESMLNEQPASEAEKKSIGDKIVEFMNAHALPVAQGVVSSVYYDVMKYLLLPEQ